MIETLDYTVQELDFEVKVSEKVYSKLLDVKKSIIQTKMYCRKNGYPTARQEELLEAIEKIVDCYNENYYIYEPFELLFNYFSKKKKQYKDRGAYVYYKKYYDNLKYINEKLIEFINNNDEEEMF